MPYMSYADWYRQEQQRLLSQGIIRAPGAVMPRGYVDTPTSFEQIGGTALNIGTDLAKQEIINAARDYLAGTTTATTAGTAAGTSTGAAAGTAAGSAGSAGAGAGSSAASAAGTAAGVAGTIYGGYNLSRDINKRRGATATAKSGATTGAAIGSFFGPVGVGIGAAAGALIGAGLGAIWSPRKKNIEKDRWKRLKAYGFDVPKPDWVDTKDAALKAQDKTLANDFVGYNEQGKWVNNKFANSGKDADLKAQDIQEFATNHEVFGDAYGRLPEADRLRIMDIALQNNLVREHHGTVDINWTPETLSQATDILAANEAKNPNYNRQIYVPDFGASIEASF